MIYPVLMIQYFEENSLESQVFVYELINQSLLNQTKIYSSQGPEFILNDF
jgi:hypothetical protein